MRLVFTPSLTHEKPVQDHSEIIRRIERPPSGGIHTADLASLNLKEPEKALWLSLLDEKVSHQTGKHINTQTL